ncbi:hypothetical protein BDR22DRAFT_869543 [Usnea florida]
MGDIDSSDFGFWSTGPDKSNEDPLPRQGREQPGDNGGFSTHLTNINNSVTSARPRTSSQTHRPDLIIHTALDKRQAAGFTLNSNRPATQMFSPTLGRSAELPASKNPPGLMQKLMQLGGVMYDLQGTYSPDKHGSGPLTVSPNTFPIELAGKVL